MSYVIPYAPNPVDSPADPPSWSSDYLPEYGIDSVLDAPSAMQNDRNVDYRNIATTVHLGSDYDDGDFATTVGLSSSDYDDYFTATDSTLADNETSTTWMTTFTATDSTLADNETSTTWMTTTMTTTIARLNDTGVGHEKPTMKELEERIFIPEGVIVFLIMLCIFAFGLIRIKYR